LESWLSVLDRLRYEFIAAMFWLMRRPMVHSSWKTAAGWLPVGWYVLPSWRDAPLIGRTSPDLRFLRLNLFSLSAVHVARTEGGGASGCSPRPLPVRA
jgi:hypothetical protein